MTPTRSASTQDAHPTSGPHGGDDDRAEDRPVPEDQVSPYGPAD